MSFMSWNCQGAGSTETVQRIRKIRRTHFPDFMFLCETKQRFDYINKLRLILGYDGVVTVEPEGLSGGLAVLWKKSYDVEVISNNKHIIDLRIRLGSLSFFVSCVYGDPIRERRQCVWDQLIAIGLLRNDAWMLVGDFNELLGNEEKMGGAVRHESTFWNFRRMVENCKLKELKHEGISLSWAGWRDKVWVQCRLDRSFGNDEWFGLFPRGKAEYWDMWASDHTPVYVTFAWEEEDRGHERFYFDKRMIGKPGFEDIVKQGWYGVELDAVCLMDRIARCRREISIWKRSANINSKDRIMKLRENLE